MIERDFGFFLKTKFFIWIFILFSPAASWADLPLTTEDLLTNKNELRLEFLVNYVNSDRRNVNTRFDLVQTGTDSFVLLPVNVSSQRQNSDIAVFTLGARYGVTSKTEIYNRIIATIDNTRFQSEVETDSRSSEQWNDFVLGINHQLSADNDTPALLVFAEISVLENSATNGTDIVYGKSGQLGFTTYRSIDPVVLSLTTGYRYAGRRDIDGQSVDPGDLFFINPSLGFAINNEVTVTGGVQFNFRGDDEVEGERIGIRTSQTDLDFGVGYSVGEKITLNFNVRTDISSDSGAQAGFNVLYKLGN